MRVFTVFGWAVLLATAVYAQNRGGFVNPQPFVQGSFGNVVFPGSVSLPGIQRSFGNVVFPGGGGPHFVVPGAAYPGLVARPGLAGGGLSRGVTGAAGSGRRGALTVLPYAVPVWIGGPGFYDNPYLSAAGAPQPPVPPNATVVFPPLQQPVFPSPLAGGDDFAGGGAFAPVTQPSPEEAAAPEPEHYLIAFKDHTIYAALAFWVEGDTLHYFTEGNTHNQVSLSLIDKDLTNRLNRESGANLQLP